MTHRLTDDVKEIRMNNGSTIELIDTGESPYRSAIVDETEKELSECRAALREAFAWGLELRHKKGCDWAAPASNFQKNKKCSCGRDALKSKLNLIAFGQ